MAVMGGKLPLEQVLRQRPNNHFPERKLVVGFKQRPRRPAIVKGRQGSDSCIEAVLNVVGSRMVHPLPIIIHNVRRPLARLKAVPVKPMRAFERNRRVFKRAWRRKTYR